MRDRSELEKPREEADREKLNTERKLEPKRAKSRAVAKVAAAMPKSVVLLPSPLSKRKEFIGAERNAGY